jgi:hypothetical protein
MSVSQNFPNIAPSLSLDFANVKALDSRVTFTRASSARYYNGVTTTKAEENLLIRSQEFDNASWSKQNTTVVANATTAPDGTTTADTLVENTANSVHNIRFFNYTVLPLTTYVASVFVKVNGRSIVYIDMTRVGVTNHRTWFDLTGSGSVLTSDAANTGAITSVGNGWFRISVTRTTVSGQTAQTFEFGPATADNTTIYTGDGTSGIFLWGAQLEQRSALTAYQVTTTQPITNYIPTLLTATNNVARFDHNPTTGESLGLLIEEQRTNLLLRSQEFDNAYWTKTRSSITANTIIAPDGTLTGDKLVEDTSATTTHVVFKSVTTTSGTVYTHSVYVKEGERSWAIVQNGSAYAWFNLSNGTIGTQVPSTTGTFAITSVGNGWYRCSVSQVASTSMSCGIYASSDDNVLNYTGDGYSGIYIWGAQLE